MNSVSEVIRWIVLPPAELGESGGAEGQGPDVEKGARWRDELRLDMALW